MTYKIWEPIEGLATPNLIACIRSKREALAKVQELANENGRTLILERPDGSRQTVRSEQV